MKQLSILLPSAPGNAARLNRFLQSVTDTVSDPSDIEIVICLDSWKDQKAGDVCHWGGLVYTYADPSKYRSHFFNQAWKASTGRFLLMANDDIIFKTKGWDKLIPYDKYPDELVLFYFRDNEFNETFSCHPVWSRKAMEYAEGLFEPDYWITKCDNTIWDIHPSVRRHYLPNIEIEHRQTPYGPEWKGAYEYDDAEYMKDENVTKRKQVYNRIMNEIKMDQNKVMIGVTTAEFARRADFYDYLNMLEKPANSMVLTIHGQSIAHNRNRIVEAALIHNCTHVFFLDDDVLCRPNALLNLLKHDKDIVCALQLKRNFPHRPIVAIDSDLHSLDLTETKDGLIPINGAGLGACLIRTEVFKVLKDYNGFSPIFKVGQIKFDQLEEDTDFFIRALDLGFKAYCDLDTKVGHIASLVVWPEYIDGHWYTSYDTNGEGRIMAPQVPLPKLVVTQ